MTKNFDHDHLEHNPQWWQKKTRQNHPGDKIPLGQNTLVTKHHYDITPLDSFVLFYELSLATIKTILPIVLSELGFYE